jgi:lipopolysaccharide/colanic/teichoic acid biosynthesis glycosyltransferase
MKVSSLLIGKLKLLSDHLHENSGYERYKVLFDWMFALLALLVTMPLLIVVAAILFFIFQGNPFYFQRRALSLNKKIFTIIKFRTMPADAPVPACLEEVFSKNAAAQNIPAFCYWLRKTGLDELPQVLNVLIGDMSFIGPRPLSVEDLRMIKESSPEYYAQRSRLHSRPGITGFWQVFGDRKGGTKNLIEMDEAYEQRKSLFLDVYLILKTLPIMLFADHSDAVFGGDSASAVEEIHSKNNGLLRTFFSEQKVSV